MQNDLPLGDEQQPPLERRLATILMADVAGYSRMMGKDEERTVQMLRGHRQIFDSLLASHRGRIFNTAGDAVLAEFPSAVEAVRCATDIQSALRTRNEHFPEEERMWFRIGINLGDVIVQGTDLLGDGVNVAARIQTIAEPGGVCISGSVYDQIQNKLTLQFKLLGERSFKNIAQPIRTFSISEANGTAMPVTVSPPKTARGGKKAFAIVAGLSILVLLAGFGVWLYRDQQIRRAEEGLRMEHEARLAAEAQASKEALARAEIEKRRLDLKLKRTAMGQRAAGTADPEAAAGKTTSETIPQAPAATATAPPAAMPASEGIAAGRFDGSYEGRLCNDRSAAQPEKRCWPVQLQVAQNELSASWPVGRLGKTGKLRGTISVDGEVAITLDGWQEDGKPTSAGLKGKWEDKAIHAAGNWQGGRPITGEWQRRE